MNAAKHTPAPWWVTDSGVRDTGGYICHTNKATHYQGQDERYETETAERAANAHLLATAPELLSELQTTTFLLTSACLLIEDAEARKTALAAVKRARAVIAKATGSAS